MAEYFTQSVEAYPEAFSILESIDFWNGYEPECMAQGEGGFSGLCHGGDGWFLNPEKAPTGEPDDWCLLDVFDAWLTHHDGTIRCQTFQEYLQVVLLGIAFWSEEKLPDRMCNQYFATFFPDGDSRKVTCAMLPVHHGSGYGGGFHPALQESHFLRLRGQKLAEQMESQAVVAKHMNAVLDALRQQEK